MKIYKVDIAKIYKKALDIPAETPEEAETIVREMFNQQRLNFTEDESSLCMATADKRGFINSPDFIVGHIGIPDCVRNGIQEYTWFECTVNCKTKEVTAHTNFYFGGPAILWIYGAYVDLYGRDKAGTGMYWSKNVKGKE